MRETYDFRISEKSAQEVLPDNVGERRGATVRRVVVAPSDPLFAQIGRLERELWARRQLFVSGWICKRTYSRSELEAAELFHIEPKRVFEPAGEQCGTIYDETEACDHVYSSIGEREICGHLFPPAVSSCGVGVRQVSPLFLDGRSIPRKVDFSRTIAHEIVVSAQVREVFQQEGLTGAKFDPVRLSNKGGRPSAEHYQLNVVGPRVEIDPSTRGGDYPFDEFDPSPCPRGHSAGNALLSEVVVQRRSLADADLMATRQMIGHHGGVIWPNPILLISPKAWRAIEKHKLKGLTIEVAHVV